MLRVLRPGGLYLANCADRPPLGMVRRELATAAAALGADGSPARETWDRVGLIAEPGQLKGRRYGNLVVAAVRGTGASTGQGSPADAVEAADAFGLDDAGLARALRSLPVPATLLTGEEARRFAGTASPIEDTAHDDRPDAAPHPGATAAEPRATLGPEPE
ncbi:hypothetical protein NKG05_00415 [Oerskovia sp. M15]